MEKSLVESFGNPDTCNLSECMHFDFDRSERAMEACFRQESKTTSRNCEWKSQICEIKSGNYFFFLLSGGNTLQ